MPASPFHLILAICVAGLPTITAFAQDADAPPGNEARRTLERSNFHDQRNPDLAVLQSPTAGQQDLPRDALGFVDWMRAIRQGVIKPRASLDGRATMPTLDLDVILKDTREMPWVRFPHLSHTLWLDCSNCHPAPFTAKAGANDISMADIFRGKFCGMCHDRVAFVTFFSCDRCHSVPQVQK